MVTPQEIRTVTFERTMRGYRCEDVDEFLQQAAESLEALTKEADQLKTQKDEADQKLYILAEKIEEYRKEEDTLKTALLNAQRMGENIIREARQKAEGILREANIKAEDLTRDSKEQVEEQKHELERIQCEVGRFKTSVLALYKQHIESLSTLPGEESSEEPEPEEEPAEPETPAEGASPAALPKAQPAPAAPAAAKNEEAAPQAPQKAEEQKAAQPAPEPAAKPNEPEQSAQPDIWATDFKPDPIPAAGEGEEVSAETTLNLTQQPAATPQEEEAPLPSIFEGFQGIRFSD